MPYNVDPGKLAIRPEVPAGLRAMQDAGFRLFVISNQSGIGLGLFTEEELLRCYAVLSGRLADEGVRLEQLYFCPHPAAQRCICRKPAPALIRRAANEHGIDLGKSWMVGDILADVEAGHRAGCRSALLDVGNETKWLAGPDREPDVVTNDFRLLTRAILAKSQSARTLLPC